MKHQPEKAEQAHIVRLLRSLGAMVYVTGTRRRKGDYQGTMMSPGIPDLEAFLPVRTDTIGTRYRELLKVEVKAAGGRLRPEQAEYRELCCVARVHHIVGGVDAVIAWLIERGYIADKNVPHYRLPKPPAAAPAAPSGGDR